MVARPAWDSPLASHNHVRQFLVLSSPLSQAGATHPVHAKLVIPDKADFASATVRGQILAKVPETLLSAYTSQHVVFVKSPAFWSINTVVTFESTCSKSEVSFSTFLHNVPFTVSRAYFETRANVYSIT